MSIVFSTTKSVPISGAVSIGASLCRQPTPDTTLSMTDYSSQYYGNVVGAPMLSTADDPPIIASAPYDNQIVISDKVIYSDIEEIDTVILGYEYQLKHDHYDEAHPSRTIKLCYLGGGPVPDAMYKLESCSTIMWEDYRDKGASMYQRYDLALTWAPVPTGVTDYRLRLLLSEDLFFENQTICVMYTKIAPHTGDTTPAHTSPGWIEIVNPKKLYIYNTDYSFSGAAINLAGSLAGKVAWVQRSKLANIRPEMAYASDRQGWFIKVWGGIFKDTDDNVYSIPELTEEQACAIDFSTGDVIIDPPSRLMVYDQVRRIDDMMISLGERPISYWTYGYPSYIPYPAYDAVYYTGIDPTAEEEYSHGISIFVNGSKIDNNVIRDIDEWTGLVLLYSALPEGADIRATYYCENKYYTLQVPDMCPQVHHIGLPYGSGDSIYGMGENDSIVIAMLPDAPSSEGLVWYYKSTNPTDIYDGSKYGWSTVISDSPESEATIPLISDTLKLAEISVQRTPPEAIAKLYDSRVQGGGLFPDNYYQLLRPGNTTRSLINSDSDYYADIGLYDGIGLKKDGVIIVKIPVSKIYEIRDAIVTYSGEEIKRMAGLLRGDDDTLGVDPSIALATEIYRTDYAYLEAIRTIRDAADTNSAAGTRVVLVDENMNVI